MSLSRSRRRHKSADDARSDRRLTRGLVAAVAVVGVSLVGAFAAGVRDDIATGVAGDRAVVIEARKDDSGWAFTYPNGDTQSDRVMVPVGREIRFDLATDDDPALFFVPELRLRATLPAGSWATVTFEPRETGTARVLGAKGSQVGEIRAVPESEFDEYLRVGPSNPYCPSADGCMAEQMARWGQDLFLQNACVGCHSRDGSKLVGPSFKGVFGRDETMTTGLVVHIDEAYVRESIRQPQAKIVKGFEAVAMPSFAGLSDRKVDALVAYLKTLK